MDPTLSYYDNNAPKAASEYDKIDFRSNVDRFLKLLRPGASVLDIGSGSGRDAAYLLSRGVKVSILDGSQAMLQAAIALHPELTGREILCALPDPIPVQAGVFGGAMAWASLMHLPADVLTAVFAEVARVLALGGIFAYSVNTQRPGPDQHGTDERGRHFTCLELRAWERIHLAAAFATIEKEETEDLSGRSGVRWATFLTRKVSDESRST